MHRGAEYRPPAERGHAAALLDDRHDPLSEDVFGHGDYARTLADALAMAPDAMTIGLFGEWGIGKSSVLHALSDATPASTAVVVFDAWRYGEDAFRREFLRDVAERLVEQKAIGRYDVKRDLADLDIDTATPSEFLRIGRPRLVGFALAILLLVLGWLAVDGRIADTDTDGKVGLLAVIGLVGLIIGRVELLAKVQTRTETRRRLEDADRFARRFRELLSAVKADHLVIAVDNVDRLEPEAAIDVLSTVKTYLEPAIDRPASTAGQRILRREPSPTKVNFVVAVDADALVAHLHETRRATPDRPPDEFLRKFFAARITMRSLLDDDLQPFVRRRVEPLVNAWTPDARDLDLDITTADWRKRQVDSLTDLIVAGVRRNPRRLKQFINSIQLAMLLLDLRHRQGLLPDPPTELDLVAQLVFIEEDCPEIFKSVLENPDRLDDLHLAAQGAASSLFEKSPEWPLLVPVLRTTFSVDRSRARTYLRLKVSDIEQRLPDHDAIRAALRAGDVDEVELRLDPAAYVYGEQRPSAVRRAAGQLDSVAAWAEHLPELVRQELAGGRTDIVFNILRSLLEVDVLFSCEEPATATIGRAMADPEIRANSWRLPAARLLEVVDRLGLEPRQAVFDALGRWYSSPIDATSEQLDALAHALADRGLPLSEHVVTSLRESLAAQPRLGQLDYAPIVRVRPDIFPGAAIEPLLALMEDAIKPPAVVRGPGDQPGAETVMQSRDQAVAAIRRWLDGPGHVVFVALVTAGRLPLDGRLGGLLVATLENTQWQDAVRDRVLSLIGHVVRSAPEVDGQAVEDLTVATRVYVTLAQRASAASLMAVATCLGRHRGATGHRPQVLGDLTRVGIDRVAALVRETDAQLEGPLRAWLLAYAADHLSKHPKNEPASELVARLDPNALLVDASPDTIAEAFRTWVDDPDHQDDLIVAVGTAGFDDRAAVDIEGLGLQAVAALEPQPEDLDDFRATLALTVEAQISLEPDDLKPGVSGESTAELDVSATLRLRRDPVDPDEIAVTLVDVIL